MRVVFAGGGTGGHLYPAIAVADALGKRADVTFIGTADRLEATIVPNAGYQLVTIPARPLSRSVVGGAQASLTNVAGMAQAAREIARLRPDVVVATGGYVCFPVVAATRMLRGLGRARAPIALLEGNAQPGLTSRMVAPLVDEVWGAYDEPDTRFAGKFVRTGVPVRASIASLPARAEAVARLELDPARKTLLVMGGSQGARSINDAVSQVPNLPAGWQVLLIAGRDGERIAREAKLGADDLHVTTYLNDPAIAFAAADLVLARAGASTLAELATLGLPAILVPYPHATDDHQRANALAFARSGGAVVVEDRQLSPETLAALLAETCAPQRLAALGAAARSNHTGNAVHAVVARIDALVSRKSAR